MFLELKDAEGKFHPGGCYSKKLSPQDMFSDCGSPLQLNFQIILCPHTLETMPRSKRSHRNEKPSTTREEPCSKKDPGEPKEINNLNVFCTIC